MLRFTTRLCTFWMQVRLHEIIQISEIPKLSGKPNHCLNGFTRGGVANPVGGVIHEASCRLRRPRGC